jgi:hypothetical protein
MDVPITVAIISASAAAIVPAGIFYLTKRKERQADWQRYKFDLYKELVQSLSGIVEGDSEPDGHRRFASACNTVHLIASKGVIEALRDYQDEIRVSNADRSDRRHNELLSRLLWEIREDAGILCNPPADEFHVRLWASGAPPDNVAKSREG